MAVFYSVIRNFWWMLLCSDFLSHLLSLSAAGACSTNTPLKRKVARQDRFPPMRRGALWAAQHTPPLKRKVAREARFPPVSEEGGPNVLQSITLTQTRGDTQSSSRQAPVSPDTRCSTEHPRHVKLKDGALSP